MKKLAFLLFLISSQALGGLIGGLDPQDVERVNGVVNGGFENRLQGWDSLIGTFSYNSAGLNVAHGEGAASWTPGNGQLQSSTWLSEPGEAGSTCVFKFSYKGGDGAITAKLQASAADVASYVLQTSTDWTPVEVVYSCPAVASTMQIILEAGGAGAITYIDDFYVSKKSVSAAVNPIVYQSERSIGTVGSVANDKGPITSNDIAFSNSAYFPLDDLAGRGLSNLGIQGGNLTNINSVPFETKGFFGREALSNFTAKPFSFKRYGV